MKNPLRPDREKTNPSGQKRAAIAALSGQLAAGAAAGRIDRTGKIGSVLEGYARRAMP
jgi:hypothetical protein